MEVTGPVSQFSDRPYKGRLSQFIGTNGEKALIFSDRYLVSKLAQSWGWVQKGRNHKLREFQAALENEEGTSDDVAFYLDLEQEKTYTELLKDNGIIKSPSAWRRRASLISHLVKNGIVTTVMAPLTLPAGAFAIAGRMATVGSMGIVTCLEPTTHTAWDGESPLRFLTMNLAGTPLTTMNDHNLMPPNEPRVNDVVAKILTSDVDIICFQEAFDVNLMTSVGEKLKEENWSSLYASKLGGTFKLNSGLFAATRLGKIVYVGFQEYDNLVSWDKDSAKGVLVLIIELNDETRICVATTHMQAGYPEEWSKEERIDNKTAEFHQARNFIEKVNAEWGAKDVFFMGDFNVSRFTQSGKSLNQVVMNPLYDAMVDGLLRPTETQNGYKAFTIPNREDTFEDYLKDETTFKLVPENEERGVAAGTCFNSAATSFHYAIDIVAIQLKDWVKDLTKKEAKKMVVRHLRGKSIKKPEYAETIDQIVQDLEVYVKSNTVDQFTQQDNKGNRFKPVGYEYLTHLFFGPEGSDSDHRGLIVTVNPE